MNLSEKVDAYLDARAERDRLKLIKSRFEKGFKVLESELIDAFLNENKKSLATDEESPYGKLNIGLRRKFSCSVTLSNEAQIRAWLTEELGDDAEFVTEKVNAKALTEWLEERINKEEVQPENLPEFMKPKTRPGISVIGWKTRKQ